MNIAESSLAEVGYCIHAAMRLGYLSEAVAAKLESEVRRVGAPLAGLIRSMRVAVMSQATGALLLLCGFLWTV